MDKVKCEICGKEFRQITTRHLLTHNLSIEEYKVLYPNSKMISDSLRQELSDKNFMKNNGHKFRGENNHFFGKKHSEESRKKIKDNHSKLKGKDHPLYGIPKTEEHKRNMSLNHADMNGDKNPFKGKHHTIESKIKKSCSHRGISVEEFDGFYHEKYSDSINQSPEYKEWRTKIFERDNYRCRWCGSGGYLEAHHIKPKSKYPELMYDHENGITLCRDCHRSVYKHEEEWEDIFIIMIN